ncbi:ABC transporter ATP-binding protein [bacterium]|nr:ABC transporter ATP-binding protein [bacterium]
MITIQNVSKKFRLYRRPADRMLEWAGFGPRHQEFWALRDIDLAVPNGRTFGIIGPNGAGKSTLLKLITGTLIPTTGSIDVQGRVAALLELGTGFHPEFTGRQNIWVNGQMLGLSADEIREHEREIIDFSELGGFIDQPIRTYSSGMIVRLGFSIAASVNPKVLIVDEALSVGDARFAQKCIRRIRRFREAGTTILFVSHDPSAVSTLCDEAILLEQGRVISRGLPSDVLDEYNALLASKGEGNVEMRIHRSHDSVDDGPRRSGTFQALVTRLSLLDSRGEPTEIFTPGSAMSLRMRVLFFAPVENPTVGFLIKNRLGLDVFGTNTALQDLQLGSFQPGESVEVTAEIPLELGEGEYTLTVAVHQDETHLEECYDWSDRFALFRVRSAEKNKWSGMVRLAPQLSAERSTSSAGDIRAALAEVFSEVADPLLPGAHVPSPFLRGFYALEEAPDGPFRWTADEAVFVFRPEHNRMELAIGAFAREGGPSDVKVRLHSQEFGAIGEVQLEKERSVVEFLLPQEAIGRLGIFEIVVDPPFQPMEDCVPGRTPRELGVAIYAIRTIPDWEENPTWQTMIRSNSQETSKTS